MEEQERYEWITVSEFAKRKGLSSQQIYNHIKDGLYETMEFKRGEMKGYLVKCVKDGAD